MEEIWADIDGFDKYQVSNMGNIRSLKSMRILKQQDKDNGYKVIFLRKDRILRQFYVHRLVAYAFCKKRGRKRLC